MGFKTIVIAFLFTPTFVLPVSAATEPDYKSIVNTVFTEGGRADLTTNAGAGCFTEEVAYRIYQVDPNYGHLRKNPGQNQWNGHAVDAILYKPTGRSIDILSSGGQPQWIPDSIARYNANDFIVPTAGCVGTAPNPPPPGPGPQPPPGPDPGPQPPPDPGPGPEPPPQPLPGEPVPQIIGVDPKTAKAGDQVKIRGFFLSQTIILIPLRSGTSTELSAELNSGKTTATITLPSDIEPGNYDIQVIGESGNDFKSNFLTISAPLIEPAPGTSEIKNFGDLVEEIFRWALALVGAAVFVNFLWAGFLWFTAAGRPGPIGQAKEKMFNSLIGAIILLASYIILNTINPDLVKSVITLPGL